MIFLKYILLLFIKHFGYYDIHLITTLLSRQWYGIGTNLITQFIGISILGISFIKLQWK